MVTYLAGRHSWSAKDEDRQGLAEHALILSLIAVVAILALVFLGTQISSLLWQVGAQV
jgi:Flp pilus assembly pilin Flp